MREKIFRTEREIYFILIRMTTITPPWNCLIFLLCISSSWFASCFKNNPSFIIPSIDNNKLKKRNRTCMSFAPQELEKVLRKEYGSFFSPMFKQYYSSDVEFIDPLNTLVGIDKYQQNVDMLAGRTTMGNVLFKDATISLHNVEFLSQNKLQTRWTLQVTVKSLPWQPRPRFTGISVYTLNENGVITKQEDYWDSINLTNGKYNKVSFVEALGDFLGQIQRESGAEMSAPELPYELLRRGKTYEVRRYPATISIETQYDKRPEGYDRLGSYAGGSNVESKRVKYLSPTLMYISANAGSSRKKTMRWPVLYAFPGSPAPSLAQSATVLPDPTISRVSFVETPEVVVAVSRFEMAATEPVVKGYTLRLLQDLEQDGMKAVKATEDGDGGRGGDVLTVAQFDALFSLNKRRNEVWLELKEHPWLIKKSS